MDLNLISMFCVSLLIQRLNVKFIKIHLRYLLLQFLVTSTDVDGNRFVVWAVEDLEQHGDW